jgi:RluA family pseudouridine synthase
MSTGSKRGNKRSGKRGRRGIQTWTVAPRQAGIDLGHFLSEELANTSVRQARRLLGEARCRINGQLETFGSRRLRPGDVVEFDHPTAQKTTTTFEPRRVLFEDEHLIAYDKPAGLAVTPTESGKQWHLQFLLEKQFGNMFPVHRLDADTTGVVIMARSKLAQKTMEAHFRERHVQKTYQAVVRGQPKPTGRRETYLKPLNSQPGHEKWGTGRGTGAVLAITEWEVQEQIANHGALVQVFPETGRHHQIRVHLAEVGHPLIGDRLYGDRADPIHCTRQLLHASALRLPHPLGRKQLELTCPLPEDMQRALQQLQELS